MQRICFLLLLFPFLGSSQTIYVVASDTSICAGSAVAFTATAMGVSSPHYLWKLNNVIIGTDTSTISLNTLHNNDTVACTLTNAANDTTFAVSAGIVMAVDNVLYAGTITATDSNICESGSTLLTGTIAGGVWSVSNNHASIDSSGNLKGISAFYFECSSPIDDTVYYVVTNNCGIDTARKSITIFPHPNAYFEIWGDYGLHALCADGNLALRSLKLASGVTDFMCEGVVTSKHGFVTVGFNAIYGSKRGLDTIVNTSTNICGTSVYQIPVTVDAKPKSISIVRSVSALCVNAVDTLFASNAPYSQSWSGDRNTNLKLEPITAGLKITGSNAGDETIILSIGNSCGAIDTSITVRVNVTPTPITGPDSVCKGYSIDLANTVTGGFWTSNDINIASADAVSGAVSGIEKGKTTIKFTLPDGCFVTGDVEVTECASEAEIYPNPTAGEATIRLFVNLYNHYQLCNTLGQVITSNTLNSVFTTVDLGQLSRGVYFLRLTGKGNKDAVYKLVKN